MKRGVVGIGDSYTWGEGLYLLSGYRDLPLKKRHSFDMNEMRDSFIQFKNKHRFINKVADYLDTWCWVNRGNGGTNMTIEDYATRDLLTQDEFKLSDFKLAIFQFTHFGRDEYGGRGVEEQIETVNKLLTEYENNGIKVITFCWDEEIPSRDSYRKLFKDRHIDISINGITKPGFDYFIWDNNYNITVASDFRPKNLQTNDLHFNKKGHRIIADLILKKLEQDNFTL